MSGQGFVIVLHNEEEGVTMFPNLPDPQGLASLMRAQVQHHDIEDPPKYARFLDGILSFTADMEQAQVFETEEAARRALSTIPSMVMPAGISIQPL